MNESFYAPPQSNLEPCLALERSEFYIVSVRKFAILHLATLGWYGPYWFYRQWSENRRFSGSSVLPVIRALFPIAFAFPLFRKVDQSLRRQAFGSMPLWLVSAAVVLLLWLAAFPISLVGDTARGEDSAIWFGLVVAVIGAQTVNLAVVQRKMNIAALDPAGKRNATLGGVNWAWIAFGSLIWLANLMALFLPVPV